MRGEFGYIGVNQGQLRNLSGETDATVETLVKRADILIRARGCKPVSYPAKGLSAAETANCVLQTLIIPEVESLRANLLAEFPVYATQTADGDEIAMVGIVDALTLTDEAPPPLLPTGRVMWPLILKHSSITKCR